MKKANQSISSKNKSKSGAQQKAEQAIFAIAKNYAIPGKSSKKKKTKVPMSGFNLSRCAAKYALAISDPWHPSARNACLPLYPSVLSQKVTAFGRFNVTVGQAGTGFFAVVPTICNDACFAFSTTSGFLGTSVAPLTSASNVLTTGVVVQTMNNIPYSSSQLTTGDSTNTEVIGGRIVSVGVRISYTGTTMNESGTYTIYSSRTHENICGPYYASSALGSLADTVICNITREPCEFVMSVSGPQETTFDYVAGDYENASNYIYPYSGSSTNLGSLYSYNQSGFPVGSPVGIVYFTGVPGQTFLVEAVQHLEYTGPLTAAFATPTASDTRGFEIVQAATNLIPTLRQESHESETMWSLMGKGIRQVFADLKPIAIDSLFGAAKAGLAMLM